MVCLSVMGLYDVIGRAGHHIRVFLCAQFCMPRYRVAQALQLYMEVLENKSNIPVSDFTYLHRMENTTDASARVESALASPEEKLLRLWLMPYFARTNSSEGTSASSAQDVFVMMPNRTPILDIDLHMNLESDVQFPLNSLLGAGAFGEVSRRIRMTSSNFDTAAFVLIKPTCSQYLEPK